MEAVGQTTLPIRTFYFYGWLAEKFGKVHKFACSRPADIVPAMDANTGKKFSKLVKEGQYAIVKTKDIKHTTEEELLKLGDNKQLGENEIGMTFGESDFHIVPTVEGGSAWARIIVGVILVIVGVYLTATGNPYGPYITMMGVGLIVGGVIQMLTPTPKIPDYSDRESPEERPSHMFKGPVNITEQGGPVALTYGRYIVGSVVISSSLEAEDY
jgi:predicted phage tail protein